MGSSARRSAGWKRAPLIVCCAAALLGAGLSLYPRAHSLVQRWQLSQRISSARARLSDPGTESDSAHRDSALERHRLLALRDRAATLASWGNVGGCGVGGGGANASGGGVRWVGRSVTGGLVDIQCILSGTYVDGNSYTTSFNSRFASGNALFEKWIFALNVPLLVKFEDVEVSGEEQLAVPAGFGDISLQVTRKLGITNTNLLGLTLSIPTGAYDAVREGTVLPQSLQLGSGLPSATLQYDNIQDFDSGMIILGGSFSAPLGGSSEFDPEGDFVYGENAIGDYRPPALSAYVYTGYLLGPFVPSAGMSLAINLGDYRERGERLDQPPLVASANLGLEWSSDTIALLLAAIGSFSPDSVQSVTLALGITTSVF